MSNSSVWRAAQQPTPMGSSYSNKMGNTRGVSESDVRRANLSELVAHRRSTKLVSSAEHAKKYPAGAFSEHDRLQDDQKTLDCPHVASATSAPTKMDLFWEPRKCAPIKAPKVAKHCSVWTETCTIVLSGVQGHGANTARRAQLPADKLRQHCRAKAS